jgi:hypothetical protein
MGFLMDRACYAAARDFELDHIFDFSAALVHGWRRATALQTECAIERAPIQQETPRTIP